MNRMVRGVSAARWCVVAAMLLGTVAAKAQDTRQVSEPTIPASCVQLPAQLRSVSEKLAEADEQKLDTVRIQSALDKCKPGMAVELSPANGNNAFLSGPLEMRTGVTLLIDEGVTLFGSRDAAEYEMKGERGDSGAMRDDCCGCSSCGVSCSAASGACARGMQAVYQHYGCEECWDHGRWRDRWAGVREDSGQGL